MNSEKMGIESNHPIKSEINQFNSQYNSEGISIQNCQQSVGNPYYQSKFSQPQLSYNFNQLHQTQISQASSLPFPEMNEIVAINMKSEIPENGLIKISSEIERKVLTDRKSNNPPPTAISPANSNSATALALANQVH